MATVTLVVADVVLTAIGLSEGHAEGNPLLAWGIDAYGIEFMILAKIVGVWFLLIIFMLDLTQRETAMIGYGCMGLAVVHTIPVLSWSYILIGDI